MGDENVRQKWKTQGVLTKEKREKKTSGVLLKLSSSSRWQKKRLGSAR